MQRSSKSLQLPSAEAMSERMLSFNLSRTVSSTIPLLSIKCWKSEYFWMVCKFTSDISMLRVPEALVCMVYIVFFFKLFE